MCLCSPNSVNWYHQMNGWLRWDTVCHTVSHPGEYFAACIYIGYPKICLNDRYDRMHSKSKRLRRYGGGNSTIAEEFSRFQGLFPSPIVGWCEEGHRATKITLQHSQGYRQLNCLMVTKRDVLDMEVWKVLQFRNSPYVAGLQVSCQHIWPADWWETMFLIFLPVILTNMVQGQNFEQYFSWSGGTLK